jgi:cephalosporin hydroxylase
MTEISTDDPVAGFHELYYGSRRQTWKNTFWLGVAAEKCPLDLWIYQEILVERRPDVIVETGTAAGGSSLYLATLCDVLDHGTIVTVDIEDLPDRPVHRRVSYVHGSSVADETVERVRSLVPPGSTTMVILDSDHSKEHVLGELQIYAELVTPGQYLVVEDTNVNGHPVRPDFGPGPMEAVRDFLADDARFEVDADREKFFMTFNPGGYLRRVA